MAKLTVKDILEFKCKRKIVMKGARVYFTVRAAETGRINQRWCLCNKNSRGWN